MEERNVFTELFSLNVNDRVEEKQKLKYLSWSWAWAEVKKRFPSATYSIERFGETNAPYLYDEDLGYMVFTRVSIEGEEHEMWLPVMDGANKAMKNHPYTYEVKKKEWRNGKYVEVGTEEKKVEAATMFDINKTLMRCLVKNLGMFGLGLYIYSGEDLPEEVDLVDEPKKIEENQIKLLKNVYKGDNLKKLLEKNQIEKLEDMTQEKATEIIRGLQELNKKGEE